MTALVWDDSASRYFETGVSKGIFFPIDGSTGVPWNGLVSVNLDVSGGGVESYYFDGLKYMDRVLAEEFQATIQSISTPKEFEPCEGIIEVQPGMRTHFNKRDKFNMAWRTEIGNGNGLSAYKWHIAYNCLVQPATRNYQTISDNVSPDIRSFTIKTTPACGKHSYYTFDSRDGDLSTLEARLLVGDLPKCSELTGFVEECLGILVDLDVYDYGENVDDDVLTDTNQYVIHGTINNGLDTISLPADGLITINDSLATEVGSGSILADNDDTTYITSADGDLGYTVALPNLVGYVEGSEIELHIRMSISGGIDPDDPDNLDADAQVHISTDSGGDDTVGGFSDGTDEGMGFALSSVDGTPVDYVIPLDMDAWVDTDINDVVSTLSSGGYLNVVAVSNNNPDTVPEVRVYEASIEIVDNTDQNKSLRGSSFDSTSPYISQRVFNSLGDIDTDFNTNGIDFKVSKINHNVLPVSYEDHADILNWGWLDRKDESPGFIRIDASGSDVKAVVCSIDPTTSVLTTYSNVSLVLDDWYHVEGYWTATGVRFRVWNQDNLVVPVLDELLLTTYTPEASGIYYPSMVGNVTDAYEISVKNSEIDVDCRLASLDLVDGVMWETDDVHVVDSWDIIDGYITMQLSHVPIDESLILWWKSLAQEPTEYSVDLEHARVTMNLNDSVAEGDRIWVHYSYLADKAIVEPDPVAWTRVASQEVSSHYPAVSNTIALPAGTEEGDLVIFAQVGGFGSGASYSEPTNTWLYRVADTTLGDGRQCGVYVGYAPASLENINTSVGGGNNATGQFIELAVTSYRADDPTEQLKFDPHRFAVGPATTGGAPATIPVTPGKGSGAIAVALCSAWIGGLSTNVTWASSTPYVGQFTADSSDYAAISFGRTTVNPVPSAQGPETDTDDQIRTVVVGLRYS